MSQLKQELGLLDVWVISTGAILSAGIFILPGFAFAQSGPASIFAYLFAAFLALTGLLSQAELATAMPKAGGTYFYITRSMGPAAGTVYGLITFFALALKSAFGLIGMAAFTKLFISFDIKIIAFFLIILFTFINAFGAKKAGKMQLILVLCVITGLCIFAIIGFPKIKFAKFDPFFTNDFESFLSTTAFVFISFGGLLKVSSLGEEVKNPSKNLPLGMIAALICVVFFYTIIIIIIFGTVDKTILSNSLTPISDSAKEMNIPLLPKIMAAMAVLGFSAAANTGIMGASRYPFALGRDRLLPEITGYISPKLGTPISGLIITAVLMIGAICLKIQVLVKTASSILILTYMFTCLAVIILKESKIQNYKPGFNSPLYPWVQIIGITGFSILLFSLGTLAFVTTLILMLLGFFIYFFYGRKNLDKNPDHALLHLIARITAKEISSRDLETELKEIIYKRDDIIKDEFYELAEKAHILDIENEIDIDVFFKKVANIMQESLEMPAKQIFKLLMERENESSTMITPDVAIPHIIVEGSNKFCLLLARSKEGIYFELEESKVKAVFVLFGTKDQRNLHLKTLAAIAQIIKEPKFIGDWTDAKDSESLRDIILLGKRSA